MMACTRWHTGTKTSGGRKLCIRRHNQQLFTNKSAFGPVRQIIDNRLIRFGYISFNLVDFQRGGKSLCQTYQCNGKSDRILSLEISGGEAHNVLPSIGRNFRAVVIFYTSAEHNFHPTDQVLPQITKFVNLKQWGLYGKNGSIPKHKNI